MAGLICTSEQLLCQFGQCTSTEEPQKQGEHLGGSGHSSGKSSLE